MSSFVIDVESDGPIPGKYSMVCFGVVKVDRELKTTFYGEVKPISSEWVPLALAVSKITREQHELFNDPKKVMIEFNSFLNSNNDGNRMIFYSDNLAYDWQFINYYFHYFLGQNPFGFSGRRIGDIYSGLVKNLYKGSAWKKLRQTSHTHNPVDDAKGNAEALIQINDMFHLNGLIS
jgi:hypothetical protein